MLSRRAYRNLTTNEYDIFESYCENGWVYAGIRALSTATAATPLVLRERVGRDWVDLLDEPVLEFLRAPNVDDDDDTLMEATITYEFLTGESLWLMGDRAGPDVLPEAMTVTSPCFDLKPIVNKTTGRIVGWTSQTASEDNPPFIFLRRDVVHFKFFNPKDPNSGFSPLTAAKRNLRLDNKTQAYNEAFFDNFADLGGYFETDDDLTPKEYDDIVSRIEKRHEGYNRAKRFAVLYNGLKYKPLQHNFRDMEYSKQLDWNLSMLLATLRIPKGEMLSDAESFAAARVHDRSFWTKAVIPLQEHLRKKINRQFIRPLYPGRKVELFFDRSAVPALQDALMEKVEMANKLVLSRYPPNDVKNMLGLPLKDTSWGNEAIGDFSTIFLSDLVPQGNPNQLEDSLDQDRINEREKQERDRERMKALEDALVGKLKRYLFETARVKALALAEEENGVELPVEEMDQALTRHYLDVVGEYPRAVSRVDGVLSLNRLIQECIELLDRKDSVETRKVIVKKLFNSLIGKAKRLAREEIQALMNKVDR